MNRCFTAGGKAAESATAHFKIAFELTLLTFWPPGPGERA